MRVYTVTCGSCQDFKYLGKPLWATNSGVYADRNRAVEQAEDLLRNAFISETDKKAASRSTLDDTLTITTCNGSVVIKVEVQELEL